jgi:MerR family transcriptional regulator/heat shock protein HspR
MVRQPEPDPSRGVYGIGVAASLVGSAPQNPSRSDGGTRLYSDNDLQRLRTIAELLHGGLNLAGVHMVLGLQETNERLQSELDKRAGLEEGTPESLDPL